MRLSLVTETFPPEVNGVARTVHSLATCLADLGVDVEIVRPRQRREVHYFDRRFEVRLVRGRPIPRYPELSFGEFCPRKLSGLWRTNRPDVVHVSTPGPLGLAASIAAGRLGLPWTTTFHTRFDSYTGHYGARIAETLVSRYLRWFHNRADRTFVPTRELRGQLEERGFERVVCSGRGIDGELFRPDRRSETLRREWSGAEHAPIVLHVGRMAPEKNIDLAVEAFRALQDRLPEARLVLVGGGPETSRLRECHRDVTFTGVLRGTALAEAYASADLLLFPSLTETYGNVVPEAMASGVPVVAFAEAAAGELVVDGENGVTVDSGDREAFIRATRRVGSLPRALWRTWGERARGAVEPLSWSRVASDFARELDVVAGRTRLPAAA